MRFTLGALAVVAAAGLSFACVGAAQAAVMTVDIYGKVTQQSANDLDAFQMGGGSLIGQDVHVRYVFDTDTPGATTFVNYELITLSGVGAASPIKATATIGGVTVGIPYGVGNPAGRVTYYNSLPNIDEVQYEAESYDPATETFALTTFRYWSETYEIIQNHDLTETFDHTIPNPQRFSEGYFELWTNNYAATTYFAFRGNRIVVTSGAAVPEPTGWALMIAGFGMAGAALRRREAAT